MNVAVKPVESKSVCHPSARPARKNASVLGKRIRNAVRRHYFKCLRQLGTNRDLNLTLVDDPAELGGVKTLTSLVNRQTTLSSPLLYGEQLAIIRQPDLQVPAPDLQLLELKDVAVIGGTMAVGHDGKLLHPELLHTHAMHDDKASDICRFADAGRKVVNFSAYTRFGGRARVQVGIHLLKEHSANYYHWLFECLPRLLFFIEHLKLVDPPEKFTILIEDNLLPAAHETLRRVVKFPCEIQTVRRGEMVWCDKLYYVSPFWYSLDNSRHRVNAERDYATDHYAVALTRNAFRALYQTAPPTRRIFMPRAATLARRVSNAPQVEALMRQHGFEVIQPHHYSFAEQVEIFSSAKVVIGASGAAFSNLVFMQPGTHAVIFSPKQMEVFNYYIFQQLADVPGVQLAHLLAVPAKHDDFYVHDDFSVNCDDLEALVRRLI